MSSNKRGLVEEEYVPRKKRRRDSESMSLPLDIASLYFPVPKESKKKEVVGQPAVSNWSTRVLPSQALANLVTLTAKAFAANWAILFEAKKLNGQQFQQLPDHLFQRVWPYMLEYWANYMKADFLLEVSTNSARC